MQSLNQVTATDVGGNVMVEIGYNSKGEREKNNPSFLEQKHYPNIKVIIIFFNLFLFFSGACSYLLFLRELQEYCKCYSPRHSEPFWFCSEPGYLCQIVVVKLRGHCVTKYQLLCPNYMWKICLHRRCKLTCGVSVIGGKEVNHCDFIFKHCRVKTCTSVVIVQQLVYGKDPLTSWQLVCLLI